MDVFNKQIEIEKFSRMVSVVEIESNDFNLNIPRYIDSQEPEDIQDIAAHLMGGIPGEDIVALGDYWEVCPSLKKTLFKDSTRNKYYSLMMEKDRIKQAIFDHPEFSHYSRKVQQVFNLWRKKHTPGLKEINADVKPKRLIFTLLHSHVRKIPEAKMKLCGPMT